MLDDDRFEIVRRMENSMSSRPVYERIIFNRADQCVQGFTFETEKDKAYVEHYVYKKGNDGNEEKTVYDMFLYKNPGLKKFLRFKLHNWGIQTMESIIQKEAELTEKLRESYLKKEAEIKEKLRESLHKTEIELKEKLREGKEAIIASKDKLVLETKDKIKEKLSEMCPKSGRKTEE